MSLKKDKPNSVLLHTMIKYSLNKHLQPLFQKVMFHPRDDKFFELLHYTPKTFQCP